MARLAVLRAGPISSTHAPRAPSPELFEPGRDLNMVPRIADRLAEPLSIFRLGTIFLDMHSWLLP